MRFSWFDTWFGLPGPSRQMGRLLKDLQSSDEERQQDAARELNRLYTIVGFRRDRDPKFDEKTKALIKHGAVRTLSKMAGEGRFLRETNKAFYYFVKCGYQEELFKELGGGIPGLVQLVKNGPEEKKVPACLLLGILLRVRKRKPAEIPEDPFAFFKYLEKNEPEDPATLTDFLTKTLREGAKDLALEDCPEECRKMFPEAKDSRELVEQIVEILQWKLENDLKNPKSKPRYGYGADVKLVLSLETSLPPLLDCLNARSEKLREAGLLNLRELAGEQDILPALVEQGTVEILVNMVGQIPEPAHDYLLRTLYELIRFGPAEAVKKAGGIQALGKYLSDLAEIEEEDYFWSCESCLAALAQQEGGAEEVVKTGAVEHVARALAKRPEDEQLYNFLHWLSSLGQAEAVVDAGAIDPLVRNTKLKDDINYPAIQAFGVLAATARNGQAQALVEAGLSGLFLKALEDKECQIRYAAAVALGFMGVEEALPKLEELFSDMDEEGGQDWSLEKGWYWEPVGKAAKEAVERITLQNKRG